MLTSLTDPSGAQVSYNYDSTGRLTSMPASGYSGVTNFLSNTQYRASGAMKHATYGNNVQLDLTYNSRMQIGQYQLAGFQSPIGTMGATMSYYADGRTNTAFDLNEARFDRKYEFDFAARLKEAYSGLEAHGAPPPPPEQINSPYRQSYTYDQWSNVTLRSGRIWSVQSDYETASYNSNNKREYEFTYDDAGNVTWSNYDGGRSYDAAGRPVTFASAQYWQVWPNWPTNPPHPANSPALETIDTFDGTGHVVKNVKTTRNDATQDWGNGPIYWMAESTTTTYYVRSTVLGGKTIVELDQSGVKTKGYVYAGGSRIATHHVSTGGSSVALESVNPITGATIATDVNGTYVSREEPDPLGRELSTPPDPLLVVDPIASSKLAEPMPIEYAPNWTGELETGMAQHFDTMDMVTAREAFKRWLRSERTSNAEYSIWLNILNRNPNVGIAAGKKTLWGSNAAEYLKNNADLIALGDNETIIQQKEKPKYPPATESDINIVGTSSSFERIRDEIMADIIDIANNQKCSDAFQKHGIRKPYDVVLSDKLRIVPHAFLYDRTASQTLGIEQNRLNTAAYDLSDGYIFQGDAAVTLTGNHRPAIVIGQNITAARYLGIKAVLIHEFIHAGGKRGQGSGVNGDLTYMGDAYREIQVACGGKSK